MKKLSEMDIIMHRGVNSPYMENTLEAFLYSIQIGFKAIEMDLRYSFIQKIFFLEHDFLHHPRFRKNTADKVFPHLPQDIKLYIELKTNSFFTNIFSNAFSKLYKKYLIDREIIIISFNPFILFKIKKLHPEIKVGFLCGSRFFLFLFKNIVYPFILKPDLLVINRRLLKHKTVLFARKAGMKIYCYVINDNDDKYKSINMNVDGIVTDYPI